MEVACIPAGQKMRASENFGTSAEWMLERLLETYV